MLKARMKGPGFLKQDANMDNPEAAEQEGKPKMAKQRRQALHAKPLCRQVCGEEDRIFLEHYGEGGHQLRVCSERGLDLLLC